MNKVLVPVTAYGNRTVEVDKLAISAELDQQNEIFFKLEGQAPGRSSAIKFEYGSVEDAVKEFTNIVKEMLKEQVKELKKKG